MTATDEAAQYGMVTACYFAIFMYRYNKGYIATDKRAIVNFVSVFMVAQPLCRIAGGMNGLVAFTALCMSSIILLPSPYQDRKDEEERKKKEEEKAKKKAASGSKEKRKKLKKT